MVLGGDITWVTFEVLTHLDSALDEEVEIFWDFWGDTSSTEDTGNTGTSVVVDETDGELITED